MKIYSRGPGGNAFYIMGTVDGILRASGREDEIPDAMQRMKSGDYANLCAVAKEVTFGSVEVVDDEEEADC